MSMVSHFLVQVGGLQWWFQWSNHELRMGFATCLEEQIQVSQEIQQHWRLHRTPMEWNKTNICLYIIIKYDIIYDI